MVGRRPRPSAGGEAPRNDAGPGAAAESLGPPVTVIAPAAAPDGPRSERPARPSPPYSESRDTRLRPRLRHGPRDVLRQESDPHLQASLPWK